MKHFNQLLAKQIDRWCPAWVAM